ncbi:MAG: hypothetical protein N4A40_07015 [Tissierellales bacterium]|nr:hypothetical protein [Tissierellales bacterium]
MKERNESEPKLVCMTDNSKLDEKVQYIGLVIYIETVVSQQAEQLNLGSTVSEAVGYISR